MSEAAVDDETGAGVNEAVDLLTAPDINRYCGYDHKSSVCPMLNACWHHRRNAFVERTLERDRTSRPLGTALDPGTNLANDLEESASLLAHAGHLQGANRLRDHAARIRALTGRKETP